MCPLTELMAYIEKKVIKGRTYYYLTETKRVGGKFKKTRTYLGTKIPKGMEKRLKGARRVKRYLTKKQRGLLDSVKRNFLKTHRIDRSLWETEKKRLVEFIYNTNAIEGNTLTLKDTANVLEGKKPKKELKKKDVQEAKNMKTCVDFLFGHKGDITLELILKLHRMEVGQIEHDAGRFRTYNVRVGDYICPDASKVPELMNEFMDWYEEVGGKLHPLELAALVHLKFVRIHPFGDGNGRMARLLMNFVMLKEKYPLINIFNDEKIVYYLVLKKYDIEKKEKDFVRYIYAVFGNQYTEYISKKKK